MREIAELYGCKSSLHSIEDYRRHSGIESISSTCFGSARMSGLLIDDGLDFDKKYDIEWHKDYVPFVGRILRIEHLAGKILDEVRTLWLLVYFSISVWVIINDERLIFIPYYRLSHIVGFSRWSSMDAEQVYGSFC